jgi:hypothetical protein
MRSLVANLLSSFFANRILYFWSSHKLTNDIKAITSIDLEKQAESADAQDSIPGVSVQLDCPSR